jgi:hypothetical protein
MRFAWGTISRLMITLGEKIIKSLANFESETFTLEARAD